MRRRGLYVRVRVDVSLFLARRRPRSEVPSRGVYVSGDPVPRTERLYGVDNDEDEMVQRFWPRGRVTRTVATSSRTAPAARCSATRRRSGPGSDDSTDFSPSWTCPRCLSRTRAPTRLSGRPRAPRGTREDRTPFHRRPRLSPRAGDAPRLPRRAAADAALAPPSERHDG